MTAHHIITEEHTIAQCPYCGKKNPPNFKSLHELRFHYKVMTCSCGKEIRIKFHDGSGHDRFNEKVKNLDALVKEA